MDRDLDGDGVISTMEAAGSDRLRKMRATYEDRVPGGALSPAFDTNQDGRVLLVECRIAVSAFLKRVDSDRDQKVSQTEYVAIRDHLNGLRRMVIDKTRNNRPVRCSLTDVPRDGVALLLSGHEGSALTNLQLGRNRRPVTMAEIVVPSGADPVHILASFRYPMVLPVTGPGAGRVKTVAGLTVPVAAIGTGQGTNHLRASCSVNLLDGDDAHREALIARFKEKLGHDRLAVVFDHEIGRVHLSRGEVDRNALLDGHRMPGEGALASATLRETLLEFNLGGFHVLDARNVSSYVEISAPELFPQEAGLIQLVERGALRPVRLSTAEGLARRVAPGDPLAARLARQLSRNPVDRVLKLGRDTFVVQPDGTWVGRATPSFVMPEPVQLPRGLDGAHNLRIITPPGAEKPAGTHPLAQRVKRPKLPQISE